MMQRLAFLAILAVAAVACGADVWVEMTFPEVGRFEVSARCSEGDNAGLCLFNLDISGAETLTNTSPAAYFEYGGSRYPLGGFTLFRSGSDDPACLAGTQDSLGATGSSPVFGIGQSVGDLCSAFPDGTAFVQPSYGPRVVLGTGMFSGRLPDFAGQPGNGLTALLFDGDRSGSVLEPDAVHLPPRLAPRPGPRHDATDLDGDGRADVEVGQVVRLRDATADPDDGSAIATWSIRRYESPPPPDEMAWPGIRGIYGPDRPHVVRCPDGIPRQFDYPLLRDGVDPSVRSQWPHLRERLDLNGSDCPPPIPWPLDAGRSTEIDALAGTAVDYTFSAPGEYQVIFDLYTSDGRYEPVVEMLTVHESLPVPEPLSVLVLAAGWAGCRQRRRAGKNTLPHRP